MNKEIKISVKFTICFDEPFWVGIYERVTDNKMEVSKVIFGSEPKDNEVKYTLLKLWGNLRFSPQVSEKNFSDKRINPKRLQRQINKQLQEKGIGTKAQQALKLQ